MRNPELQLAAQAKLPADKLLNRPLFSRNVSNYVTDIVSRYRPSYSGILSSSKDRTEVTKYSTHFSEADLGVLQNKFVILYNKKKLV